MKTRLFLVFSVIAFVVSCSDIGTGGNILTPRYFTSLTEAEARWKAHKITQYSITQRRSCFCIRVNYPLSVQVENGSITRVRDAGGDSLRTDLATSIEKMFEDIRQLQSRTDATFQVQYDSVYGYPRYLSADPIKMAVDDEYTLETRLVR